MPVVHGEGAGAFARLSLDQKPLAFACHGENLAGHVMLDGPPGRFVAANLTPAGIGGTFSDADWDRAIRHGIRPDGTPLIIMGANRFRHIPDVDFAALVAYLKSLPPVENDLPDETLRPLGRFPLGAGLFVPAAARFDHNEPPPPIIPPDTTAAYGEYLVSLSCVECHGANLQGGKHPDPAGPEVPPLTLVGTWPRELFMEVLRTGAFPGGRTLDPQWMPWPEFTPLPDAEITAINNYLKTLQPPDTQPLAAQR